MLHLTVNQQWHLLEEKLGILGANIIIRPGTYTIKNLLTHEFGHAFGYTHVNEPEHIMHPVTEIMGDKFWIP